MVANKMVEGVVVVEVEENTTTSTIEMEMVTQILLNEGARLLNLKTSHTYNVLDAKSMDIISQNIKQNCRMNKLSMQTSSR